MAASIFFAVASASVHAQTTDRNRWEYAGGFIKRSRSWVEQTDKPHNFIETARNSVYVELFDPSRDYVLRLYPDKLLLRGGNRSAKSFPKFSRVYDGTWKDDQSRLEWEYEGGSFRAQRAPAKSAPWIEKNIDGLMLFTETRQTEGYVELFDRQRDYTVHLDADGLRIRGGNNRMPTHYAEFTRLYAGHWVPGERRGRLTVSIDTSDAPETAKWAEAAKQLCEIWYPITFERLYPGSRVPARTIKMIYKGPSMKGLAYTEMSLNRITISADWITKHPDDFGMAIHELTHVVQTYPASKRDNPSWVVEGIADYFRYYEFEPEKPVPVNWQKTYRDGYAIASAFLDWLQRTRNPRIIEKLNARLRIGEYTDELIGDLAGETRVPAAGSRCRLSAHRLSPECNPASCFYSRRNAGSGFHMSSGRMN